LTEQIQNDCYETQTILVISNSNKAMIIYFFCLCPWFSHVIC